MLHEGRRQRAVLQAQRMAQYETPDSSYAVLRPPRGDTVRVHVQLFTPEGDSSATITADSLLYFSDEGRADAYGNVVVRTPEGRQLYSEHVVWRQSDRKVRSSRFVRIVTPTETLNGQGLVADEDLSSYQIGRFDAEVDLDDESDDT
ncbi:LPS export ABC transporter periplasmic protein LptC [Longimonas halophila]|uniref:LPS export ABC transporter periplasmic protein LptC n=1 Tax=Longimonas halophila TaxID=1469170 RepID=A0A2H3P706_9BACT|nr:LPS export ABC transporter periplasmic protein LptC [Longimonas halophila]